MDYQEYNYKFRYLYPVMSTLLYFILLLMITAVLNNYFNMIKLNIFSSLVLFLFIFESLLRFNAGLKLKIPILVFLVEVFILYLALFISSGSIISSEGLAIRSDIIGFNDPGLWVVCVISVFAWFQNYEMVEYLFVFHKDCEKIYDKGEFRGDFDEFRRMLDYPSTWRKIRKKLFFVNIVLFIIWVFSGRFTLLLIAGTIIFLLLELLLLSLVYLDKKNIDWHIEGVQRSGFSGKTWRNTVIIILLFSVIFAAVIPYNYNPLPVERIGRWFLSIMPDLNPAREELEKTPTARPEHLAERSGEEEKSGINYFDLIFLLMQMFLYGVVIIVFIIFILALFNIELRKVKNIPDFFRKFAHFFLSFVREMFSRVRDIHLPSGFRGMFSPEERAEKVEYHREKRRVKGVKLPSDIHSMVRVIYRAMLQLLSFQGKSRRPDQTPYEYSNFIARFYTDIREEVRQITEYYVEVTYSDHSLRNTAGKIVRNLWERVKKIL